MLADAEGKAEDLLALIGDLLEVSRIEEATMTLDLQPIAPAALLNEIVARMVDSLSAGRRRRRASTSPTTRRCSRRTSRCSSACSAISFRTRSRTRRRRSRCSSAARRDGDGILFTVADNGPGIPPEYHEVIFRKFERVKNPNIPRTRSSGTGSRVL